MFVPQAALLAEDDAGGIDESPLGFHQYLKRQAAEYQVRRNVAWARMHSGGCPVHFVPFSAQWMMGMHDGGPWWSFRSIPAKWMGCLVMYIP
jgi:hypothetical protein